MAMLGCLLRVHAADSLVTGFTPGTLRNNYSGWVGMWFAVGPNPIQVSSLGRIFLTGNAANHAMRLVQVSDGTVVASATWTPAGGIDGQINYVSLGSPVTLNAGMVYYLASQEVSGGDNFYSYDTTITTTSAGIDQGAAYSNDGTTWTPYGTRGDYSYGPVSIQYSITTGDTLVSNGASYTMSPAPNYSLAVDAGDTTQLTDALFSTLTLWEDRSHAVAWELKMPVKIVIDLGSSQRISGAMWSAAARSGAGMYWPNGIFVLCSTDNTTWAYLGDLAALSPAPANITSHTRHRFESHALAGTGRYVALLISPVGSFVNCDEIQVFSNSETEPVPAVANITDLTTEFYKLRGEVCLRYRLTTDVAAVGTVLNASSLSAGLKATIQGELDTISASIPAAVIDDPATFLTIFPMHPLHSQIFGIQAEMWRDMGMSGVVVWTTNRYDPLQATSLPDPTATSMSVSVMTNEHRAVVFQLSNTDATTNTTTFSIEDLPGGSNPSYVSASLVPFTDTATGYAVAAAMIPLTASGGSFTITNAPGMTSQIWLDFAPTTTAAGTYVGYVLVNGTQHLPLTLTVHHLPFPARPALHLGGWDYTDHASGLYYAMTAATKPLIVSMITNYYVDITWGESLLTGTFDASGNQTVAPSSTTFSAWTNLWPNAWRFNCFQARSDTYSGFSVGTPEFTNAVAQWINWWTANKIPASRLAVCFLDEPSTAGNAATTVSYASVLKTYAPGVKVFTDPIFTDPSTVDPAFWANCDVLCPPIDKWIDNGSSYRDFYATQKAAGKTLALYANSSREFDPYGKFRIAAWLGWQGDMSEIYYWSFIDGRGTNSWNEYYNQINGMSPLFLTPTTVHSSKYMEAIREGVEDYEYMKMLTDKLSALAVYPDDSVLTAARNVRDTSATNVTAFLTSSSDYVWSVSKDRTIADSTRLAILSSLEDLGKYGITITRGTIGNGSFGK